MLRIYWNAKRTAYESVEWRDEWEWWMSCLWDFHKCFMDAQDVIEHEMSEWRIFDSEINVTSINCWLLHRVVAVSVGVPVLYWTLLLLLLQLSAALAAAMCFETKPFKCRLSRWIVLRASVVHCFVFHRRSLFVLWQRGTEQQHNTAVVNTYTTHIPQCLKQNADSYGFLLSSVLPLFSFWLQSLLWCVGHWMKQ